MSTLTDLEAAALHSELAKAFDHLAPLTSLEEACEFMARHKNQFATSAELSFLTRLMSRVEKMMGPGHTRLSDLAAAWPALADVIERQARVYAAATASEVGSTARLAASYGMIGLQRQLSLVSAEIRADLKSQLAHAKVPSEERVRESVAALEEFESAIRLRAATLATMSKRTTEQLLDMAQLHRNRLVVTEIISRAGKTRSEIGHSLAHLAGLPGVGDVSKVGEQLANAVIRAAAGSELDRLTALLSRRSPLFIRAAAMVAPAMERPTVWRSMVAKAWGGVPPEGQSNAIEGYLRQLRGLLPEEMAITSGTLKALGQKRAHEVLATLPADLLGDTSRWSVVHLDGPFWIPHENGSVSEFGDGASLLIDESGSGFLLTLAEAKSYLPWSLFEQLFSRSDPRAAATLMHYVDDSGVVKSVTLRPLPGNATPSYLFSRPRDMTEAEKALLARMIKAGLKDGREVYHQELPFTRDENKNFADLLLVKAVRLLEALNR